MDSTFAALPDLVRLAPSARAEPAGHDVLEFDAATLPADRDRLNTISAQHAGAVDGTGIDIASHQITDTRGTNLGIRIYRGPATSAIPIVVFAHGGGFVTGTLDTDHSFCVELARSVDCVVVSVDYRLAPEHACPAALDDVHSAFDYAVAHAGPLDADPNRIAVVGRDAGAALVAGLAHRVFDAEGPQIRLQLLHEPMLDPDPTRSRRELARISCLSGRAMDRGWEHYRRGTAASHHSAPAPTAATSRACRRHSSAARISTAVATRPSATPTDCCTPTCPPNCTSSHRDFPRWTPCTSTERCSGKYARCRCEVCGDVSPGDPDNAANEGDDHEARVGMSSAAMVGDFFSGRIDVERTECHGAEQISSAEPQRPSAVRGARAELADTQRRSIAAKRTRTR